MEKNMENEMETCIIQGILGVLVETPSIRLNNPYNGSPIESPFKELRLWLIIIIISLFRDHGSGGEWRMTWKRKENWHGRTGKHKGTM